MGFSGASKNRFSHTAVLSFATTVVWDGPKTLKNPLLLNDLSLILYPTEYARKHPLIPLRSGCQILKKKSASFPPAVFFVPLGIHQTELRLQKLLTGSLTASFPLKISRAPKGSGIVFQPSFFMGYVWVCISPK